MVDGLGWIALPLLTVSLAGGAPGRLGAAHVFIAALAGAVLTCGIAAATGRHANVAATAVTVLGLAGAAAGARMWWPVPAQWLGMCTLVALLLLLTMSPTIALCVARIRPPYFGSITGRDLFRRSAGLPADAVSPVEEGADEEANSDTTPRGAQIALAAIHANNVLTGICVGAGLMLPVAVWATLVPGHERSVPAAALATLFVVIFISRGRAFADKRQAIALVCGAAAALCAGVVKYVVHEPISSGDSVLWGALVLAGFGGGGSTGRAAGADYQVHSAGADDRRMGGNSSDHRGPAAGRMDRRVVHLGAHAMTQMALTARALTQRVAATALTSLLVALIAGVPVAQAIPPPVVDPGRVPADGKPASDQPMRQSFACARTITVADPNVALPAPGFTMLNVSKAWQYSTGNGVRVAVIDTGINPSRRLPVVPGGDYIMGGDGLTDCDAHGTAVASLIGAAPQGIPMPAPMPSAPAFPPPAGPPATDAGAPPPGGPPPPPAPPPPPSPVTITQTVAPPPPPPPDVPSNGPGDPAPGQPDDPEVPPPPPGAPDGVAGVAPHAVIISIRQSSRAFEPVNPGAGDFEGRKKAGTIATLARAIVHAANIGAKVINISVTACVSAADPLDQGAIGAAVWYAATVKDAVVVAAAGNDSEDGCAQNPSFDPLNASDPRDWHQVKTVSSPSWFSDYVLSVGAVDNTGAPINKSLAGPWVAAAAPGVGIMGLSPESGGPANAYPPIRPGEKNMPFWGTSFSAAYVSGVAALVRAKYPALSAHQIINRILQTAHNPPRGVDNQVGYGVVDPVAALTFDVPAGERLPPAAASRIVHPVPPPPPPDHRARTVALVFAGVVLAAIAVVSLIVRARRER